MHTTQSEQQTLSAGASFRIYGVGLDIDGITSELGLSPDHKHRQGEPDPGKRPYPHDMWSLRSPQGKGQDLELHLSWLAERLLPRRECIFILTEEIQGRHILLEKLLYGAGESRAIERGPQNFHRA